MVISAIAVLILSRCPVTCVKITFCIIIKIAYYWLFIYMTPIFSF